MLYTIIGFFALAAIMGMTLLSFVLRNQARPRALMIMHGLFAATGLVLLLSYVFRNKPGPMESAILFVIAALGGITMAVRELGGKTVPKWLAVIHGLVAVSGFILLLIFTLGKPA